MTAPFAAGVFCSALIGIIATRWLPEYAPLVIALGVLAPSVIYVTRRSWRRPDGEWRLALLAGVWAGSLVSVIAMRVRS
jgi:hypothetical protein